MSNVETTTMASGAAPAAAPVAVFAALGDPTRITLLSRLGDGRARSISRLTEGSGLTRQGVTKHLQVLAEVGLVRSQRVGREQRYAYAPEPIQHVRSYLDTVAAQWDSALTRLAAFVEDDGPT